MLSLNKKKSSKYEIRVGYGITFYTNKYTDTLQVKQQYGNYKVTIINL